MPEAEYFDGLADIVPKNSARHSVVAAAAIFGGCRSFAHRTVPQIDFLHGWRCYAGRFGSMRIGYLVLRECHEPSRERQSVPICWVSSQTGLGPCAGFSPAVRSSA